MIYCHDHHTLSLFFYLKMYQFLFFSTTIISLDVLDYLIDELIFLSLGVIPLILRVLVHSPAKHNPLLAV